MTIKARRNRAEHITSAAISDPNVNPPTLHPSQHSRLDDPHYSVLTHVSRGRYYDSSTRDVRCKTPVATKGHLRAAGCFCLRCLYRIRAEGRLVAGICLCRSAAASNVAEVHVHGPCSVGQQYLDRRVNTQFTESRRGLLLQSSSELEM